MPTSTTRIGRPKNEATNTLIKDQAITLIRAKGYDNVSISDIVKAAGVSRQTLYNRWSTKAELVLEAFFDLASSKTSLPDLTGSQSRRELLAKFLREVFKHIENDGECLRSLIAAAQTDPGFREIFWLRFVLPRQEIVTSLLEDARRRNEIPETSDVDVLSAFIHGAFWYRLLNGQTINETLADRIAHEIFRRQQIS